MLRKLLLCGIGTLFILSAGVAAYGDATSTQSRGASLLQTPLDQNNGISDTARATLSTANSEGSTMMAGARKAVGVASAGRDNMFVINTGHNGGGGGGTGTGTGTGSGSGSGSGTGSASKKQNGNQVPEPVSMILLGTGLVGVATIVRRRRH